MKVPKATQTVIRIVWKGGNGFLPDGKENVDELGPVMLVNGGSEGLSPDELQRQVNALGAGFQVYSKLDALHGMLIAPNDKLAETAALLNTVLAKPTMDGRWLRRFKRNFVENVSTNAKTPSGQAWLTIREVTVGDHPYRQIWNATPVENISSITIADIKDWHRRVVTSDGVRVFVAGKAEVTDIAAAVDIVLEGLPTGSGRQDFPQLEMSYPAKTILVHRPEAEKSYLLIGGPVPKIYAPNQEAREIGVGVLGVSDQSRLFTAVRKELRAAYGFKAWMDSFSRENAMIYMQGEVETAKLQDAYDTVRDTYEELRTDGIGLIEFPFAQRIFKNRAYGIAEKPRGAANLMVEAWLTGRPVEDGLRYPERAAGLSRGSVNQAIQDEFPPFSQMVKIVVSPDRDAVVADCIIADFSEADRCR
ncbi:M16 family metallopeptidase [Falsiruegeria litorea]|nr:insulinase family protein [Falsiruegeria litorea]